MYVEINVSAYKDVQETRRIEILKTDTENLRKAYRSPLCR